MIRKSLLIVALAGGVLALPSGCTPGGKSGIAQGPRISTKTHLASARMLEATGNYAGATKQYEHVIENDPDMALAYHRLAVLYVKLGYLDKAQDTLQRAIEKGADEASLRNNLGFTLMRMNRLDDAEQMLDAALAISPNFHRARMNLAICHAKAGRTDQALVNFVQVVPEDQAFYNIGVIRMQERDYVASAWAFNEALAMNPRLPGVQEKATQAVALARHAPHHPADEEILAALSNPQTGGTPAPNMPTEPFPVRTAQAQPTPQPTTPTYEPMQPAAPKIVNSRPPRTRPTESFAANNPTTDSNTGFNTNQPSSATTPNALPSMTPVANSASTNNQMGPPRNIVNSRPPRTATAMTPMQPSTNTSTERSVILPLKTIAPMQPSNATTNTFANDNDDWDGDDDSNDEWSDDWDDSDWSDTSDGNDDGTSATPMMPMQPATDPSFERVPTTEPEVQDIAYDASFEADQKMAETTWQKWFTPTDAKGSSDATPMVEVSAPRKAKPTSTTKSFAPTNKSTQSMQSTSDKSSTYSKQTPQSMTTTSTNIKRATPTTTSTNKKGSSTTATFRWNESNATMKPTTESSSATTTSASKASTSTSTMTPMQMAPADSNNNRTPSKTPFSRKRADKAVIKPIDNDEMKPMQPASDDDGSGSSNQPKSSNSNASNGRTLQMTPMK